MRILVLNWRDIKNPIKGGAEVATHELAKRWTYYGNRVTQFSSYFPGARKNELAFIYLGRLTKSKGIEDAIYAFRKIKKIIPETTLWVVGNGTIEYEKYIKMLSEELGIRDVLFYGFIPEKEKFLLLCRAHMLIFPSIREGWGLTAIEANSVKTPVVAYNSPGLRDSIVHGKAGLLCKENNPSELANNVIDLFRNKKLYKKLQIGGYEWSKQFSWKQAGRESLNFLSSV